jgi:hypothetical protein
MEEIAVKYANDYAQDYAKVWPTELASFILAALRAAIEQERREFGESDREDEYTPAIDAAHPTNTENHELYEQALRIVGNRHSKYALVDAVNWLLFINAQKDAEIERLKSRLDDERKVPYCANHADAWFTGRPHLLKALNGKCWICEETKLLTAENAELREELDKFTKAVYQPDRVLDIDAARNAEKEGK